MPSNEKIRKNVIFYGSVQGVGFRYRAYHAAHSFGVTGWVRNSPDGSVEAEFEGTADDIASVIEAIGAGRYISIDKMLTKIVPLEGDRDFRIRDSWY